MNNPNLNSGNILKQTSDINSNKRQLISKVLSPAVRLWLLKLVEQVSHLEVKISGSDRQILSGNIPHISILACQAVYQGLHLDQIQLAAEGIRTNLGQIIRGQPLRMLEPVITSADLLLQESGLNASLESSLLSGALTQLLQMLVCESYPLDKQLGWHKITIEPEHLTLSGSMGDNPNAIQLSLHCGLELYSSHEILLTHPQLDIFPSVHLELNDFRVDLGPQVDLQELTLHPGYLVCRGRITVMPPE